MGGIEKSVDPARVEIIDQNVGVYEDRDFWRASISAKKSSSECLGACFRMAATYAAALIHVCMSVRVEFPPHEIFEQSHGIDSPALGRFDDHSFQCQVERKRPLFFNAVLAMLSSFFIARI